MGINTILTNYLVAEAIRQGIVTELGHVDQIQREIKTSSHTRLDFLLQGEKGKTYLEVKNCSLVEQGVAMFPDAVTKRGTKHLNELLFLKKAGFGAAVFFCVQRQDSLSFAAARHIDQEYAETLERVHKSGVMILGYEAVVTPEGIEIVRPLPVNL